MFDEPEYPAPPFEYAKGCTMQEVAPNDYVLRAPIGTRTGRQQDALGSTGASVTVEYYERAIAPESQPVLLSPERVAEIATDSEVYPTGCKRAVADLLAHIAALAQEIDVRKRYSHFCCLAHADRALAEKRATGVGPWETIGFSTFTPNLPAPSPTSK